MPIAIGSIANSVKYSVGTSLNLTPEFSMNLDYARNLVDLKHELNEDLTQELDDDVFTIGFRYLFGKSDQKALTAPKSGAELAP